MSSALCPPLAGSAGVSTGAVGAASATGSAFVASTAGAGVASAVGAGVAGCAAGVAVAFVAAVAGKLN